MAYRFESCPDHEFHDDSLLTVSRPRIVVDSGFVFKSNHKNMEKQKTAMQLMIQWNEFRKALFNKWRQEYLEGKNTSFSDEQTYDSYTAKVYEIDEQIEALKQLLEKEKEQMTQFTFDYHDEYLNNGKIPSTEDYYNEFFSHE